MDLQFSHRVLFFFKPVMEAYAPRVAKNRLLRGINVSLSMLKYYLDLCVACYEKTIAERYTRRHASLSMLKCWSSQLRETVSRWKHKLVQCHVPGSNY